MVEKDLIKRGSQTAKGGFKNEDDVINKFFSSQKKFNGIKRKSRE